MEVLIGICIYLGFPWLLLSVVGGWPAALGGAIGILLIWAFVMAASE